MSLLICGAGGQLGSELALQAGPSARALGHTELDITQRAAVLECLQQLRPRVVINAAAYTAVDRAESESARAYAVNCEGAAHLAEACASTGAALLHVSTDYVFDGRKAAAYSEADPPNPQGVYGRSKWQGEQRISALCPRHVILRVSWLFGRHGGNFVKTILRLAHQRPELRVVADQRGGPTAAADFAAALLALAQSIETGAELAWGTYHYAGQPLTTWHDFAAAILEGALAEGLIANRPALQAITTAEYPTAAARPANSSFDTRRAEDSLGLKMPYWPTGLKQVLSALKSNESFA